MPNMSPWRSSTDWRRYLPPRGATRYPRGAGDSRYSGIRYDGGPGFYWGRRLWLGIPAWLLGLLAVQISSAAAAVIYWAMVTVLQPPVPPEPSKPPVPDTAAVFGILTDHSDPIPGYELENFLTRLTEVLPRRFSRGDRILLFKQTANVSEPVTVRFDAKSPGRRDEYDPAYENPEFGAQKYKVFSARFRNAVEKSLVPSPLRYSPICAAISQASQHPAFHDASRQTLIVLSDMLEHVPGYSAYSKNGLSELPPRCRANLVGFDVVLLVIDRGHPMQERTVRLFVRWIEASGGQAITRPRF